MRAFNPFPVALSSLFATSFDTSGGETVKLRESLVLPDAAPASAAPGEVISVSDAGVDIATGDGVLRATKLQKAGGKTLAAAEFLRGFNIRPGMIFKKGADPSAGKAA